MKCPDHLSSLEPDDFKSMTDNIRVVESMLGDGIKKPQPCEISTMKVARRSLRASRYIHKGSSFVIEDFICLRPFDGLPPTAF